jgi:small subunit ribosomal protein S21
MVWLRQVFKPPISNLQFSEMTQRGVIVLTRVVVDDNESFESALKRFNKIVQGDRILSEVRRRRFFEKPSIVRKRKKAAKVRKSRRQTLKFQRTTNM